MVTEDKLSTPPSPPLQNDTALADNDAKVAEAFLGRRVAKYFHEEVYYGTVSRWLPAYENRDKVHLWHVVYDDGDQEDYEREELDTALNLYELIPFVLDK